MTTPHQPTPHAAHAPHRRHRCRGRSRRHRGGRHRRAGLGRRGRQHAAGTIKLTVLGTTDLHGNVYNWDYFKNAEYDDAAHNDIGVAKVSTLSSSRERERRGRPAAAHPRRRRHHPGHAAGLLLRQDRADHRRHVIHPMAAAMNAIGYDAAALGNHEFNYGIAAAAHLRDAAATSRCSAPTRSTRRPAGRSSRRTSSRRIKVDRGPKPITVGILGLTNPGHRDLGQGQRRGQDGASPASSSRPRSSCPSCKAAGADVVVVSAPLRRRHLVLVRRRAAVPGERRHPASPSRCPASTRSSSATRTSRSRSASVTNTGHRQAGAALRAAATGASGCRVIDIDLSSARGNWMVAGRDRSATVLNTNTVPEDPRSSPLPCGQQHDKVVTYVNRVIGTSAAGACRRREPSYEDTADIDFINYVQADDGQGGADRYADAGLPVLSIAAPFNRAASIPAGRRHGPRRRRALHLRQHAARRCRLTGAQVKDYLEFSAQLLQAGHRAPGPFAVADRHQRGDRRPRRTAPPTTTTTSWAGSTRR